MLYRFEIGLWVFLLCSFFHQVSEGERSGAAGCCGRVGCSGTVKAKSVLVAPDLEMGLRNREV